MNPILRTIAVFLLLAAGMSPASAAFISVTVSGNWSATGADEFDLNGASFEWHSTYSTDEAAHQDCWSGNLSSYCTFRELQYLPPSDPSDPSGNYPTWPSYLAVTARPDGAPDILSNGWLAGAQKYHLYGELGSVQSYQFRLWGAAVLPSLSIDTATWEFASWDDYEPENIPPSISELMSETFTGCCNLRSSSSNELLYIANVSSIAITTVPVPPAVWLFGSALGLMGWMRRKAIA